MSTKELLKQCLAQVVQQISLFNETLKQTKKNGSVTSVHGVAAPISKPVKKRGRPPGSKNKGPLSLSSFHDLHAAPELHLKILNDTDSMDADGTHTDAEDGIGRSHHSINGDAHSVSSDDDTQSFDGRDASCSYEDRIRDLSAKYEVVAEPARSAVYLVYKILECLNKGPTNEKVLRNTVIDSCKDAGIKASNKGSAAGSSLDFNLVVAVMKGVRLVVEKEDTSALDNTSTSSSMDIQTPTSAQEAQDSTQSSTLAQTIYSRWSDIVDSYKLVAATKRAELAAQTAAAKDTAIIQHPAPNSAVGQMESKMVSQLPPFAPQLGLSPVDWQLSLLDPQTLSQMMQWVQQVSKQADQLLTSHHRPTDMRPHPSLDSLLDLKSAQLHTDLVVEELLRQMALPLPLPAPAFDQQAATSSSDAQVPTTSISTPTTTAQRPTTPVAATTPVADVKPTVQSSTAVSAVASTEKDKSNEKSDESNPSNTAPEPTTARKRPLRTFELCQSVDRALQNAESSIPEWGEICYEEARLLEQEESLLRRLAKRCGLNLPSSHTQSQTFRLGTRYLSTDSQTQARPLLWDGIPLTASLLWERARKAKRQRVHSFLNSPSYSSMHRSDDSLPPFQAHSSVYSYQPPFLSRKRSGPVATTTDYPSHHVPPLRLHSAAYVGKEIPCNHTQPVELPDLTIRSCIIPWTDIAKEFIPLRTPVDGIPLLRDESEQYPDGDNNSEDGSRSEDISEPIASIPVLKRQRSEVLAPTFRVLDESKLMDSHDQQPNAQPASSGSRIAGGFRIADTSSDNVESDNDSDEDISDEAIAARHEIVLQGMRDRFKKLQELKLKQQESLSITLPATANRAAIVVTSPKKGRKSKGRAHRLHGKAYSKHGAGGQTPTVSFSSLLEQPLTTVGDTVLITSSAAPNGSDNPQEPPQASQLQLQQQPETFQSHSLANSLENVSSSTRK